MRVRGLKPQTGKDVPQQETVAPHAGAWIETLYIYYYKLSDTVAPHAGAWIETILGYLNFRECHRRTPCGCVD